MLGTSNMASRCSWPLRQDQFEELNSIKAAVRIKVPALRVRRADIESMVKYQLRILD